MADKEPKSLEKILRAARKYKGHGLFGETDKKDNEPYFCHPDVWPESFILDSPEEEPSEQTPGLFERKKKYP